MRCSCRNTKSCHCSKRYTIRPRKSVQTFFCTKFFENALGHGHPHRKSWTFASKSVCFLQPLDGEKLFDPGFPGVRVWNVRGKSDLRNLYLCCFCSLSSCLLARSHIDLSPNQNQWHGPAETVKNMKKMFLEAIRLALSNKRTLNEHVHGITQQH